MVVVFVDGDYWHSRLFREQGKAALKASIRTNHDYWLNKFLRNVARDDFANAELKYGGWLVLRYWESDVKRDVPGTALKIARHVRRKRRALEKHVKKKGA